jgi:hypothetical protein
MTHLVLRYPHYFHLFQELTATLVYISSHGAHEQTPFVTATRWRGVTHWPVHGLVIGGYLGYCRMSADEADGRCNMTM